jgi:hypothetical protein
LCGFRSPNFGIEAYALPPSLRARRPMPHSFSKIPTLRASLGLSPSRPCLGDFFEPLSFRGTF